MNMTGWLWGALAYAILEPLVGQTWVDVLMFVLAFSNLYVYWRRSRR